MQERVKMMIDQERTGELATKISKLFNPHKTRAKVRIEYLNGNTEIARLFISGNLICKLKKRSQKYGRPLSLATVKDIRPIKSRKSTEEKWRDAWTKVKSRLNKSGLWADVVRDIDIALDMGYEELKKAYTEYWAKVPNNSIEHFKEKYPSLVYENDRGEETINTTVLYQISKIPKVKKMRFYKGSTNDAKLELIKQAMGEKKAHTEYGWYNYDIDFEYNPDKKMAWYSEKYRGCGNGHYYLALDATHAVYWEKD